MKILHFADVHYDEKNHAEIKKCMDYMIGRAKEEEIDAILCSGDVTNSQYLVADTKSAKTILAQFRIMSDIAPVAVVVGTYSHDGMTPELLKHASGKYPIHVSTKPEQLLLYARPVSGCLAWATSPPRKESEVVRLIVSQVPAPTKEFWKNRQGAETDNMNIAQAMGAIFADFSVKAARYPDTPHILNGHFSMKGSKISETQLLPGGDIAIDKETLVMARADLYCLGHIHMRQEYVLPGARGLAYHSGSIFRKTFGERKEDKGFYIHTAIHADFNDAEFIKTPTREMAQIDYDLIKEPWHLDNSDMDFAEIVFSVMKPHAEIGSWIKVKITAWMDDIRMINQSKIKRLLLEAGASNVTLEVDRVRRENSREEKIIRAKTLVEKVKALADHRSQPAPEGVFEMLEKVEALSTEDLVKYGLGRLELLETEPQAEIIKMEEREVLNGAA